MSSFYFYSEAEDLPFVYLTPSRSIGRLPSPNGISMTVTDYLRFAISDEQEGTARGQVNALANAKRAIHLGIDVLLQQFGLLAGYGRRNFPSKLRLLDEIGLIPIRILNNLNVERNAMEHDFTVPTKNRVQEAVDVARMIEIVVNHLTESTVVEGVVGWRNPRKHLVLQLEPVAGSLQLFGLRAKGKYIRVKGMTCFEGGGRLRRFMENDLAPGVTVSDRPWKSINLVEKSKSDWLNVIREFVALSTNRKHAESVEPQRGTWRLYVEIPLGMIETQGLHRAMNSMMFEARRKRSSTRAMSRRTVQNDKLSEGTETKIVKSETMTPEGMINGRR